MRMSSGRIAALSLWAFNAAVMIYMVASAGLAGGFAWLGVVGLHELGHAVVARLLGARVVKVVLIPYVGGLTFGPMRTGLDGRAAFTLGGVALSAGLAVLLLTASVVVPGGGWLASMAALMAWVNLLNLYPLTPLDGGRLAEVITSAWSPRIARLLKAAMLIVLACLAYRSGSVLLWIVIGLTGSIFLAEVWFSVPPSPSSPGDGRRAWIWLGLYLLHGLLFAGIFAAAVGRPGVAAKVAVMFPF
jgi:Zn-dependent protease